MKKVLKITSLILSAVFLVAIAYFFLYFPDNFTAKRNTLLQKGPYKISPRALALHKSLVVADLHADTLAWDQDLRKRRDYGHVDVPRLIEGNVSLQVFAAFTQIPAGLNYESNPANSDQLPPMMIAQARPFSAWFSPRGRAFAYADDMQYYASKSNGKLTLIRTSGDLAEFIERRKTDPEQTAALLALEGLQVLENDYANLQLIFDRGYRMGGLTHFFDNEVAGSAHGLKKGGLTELGKKVVRRMEELGMIIDLAHVSPRAADQVLSMVKRPIVVSHTGVKATCPGPRNLSDEQIRRIAANGGLIGIGYWKGAICKLDVHSIVRAMSHVKKLVGVDNLALGSDFDGSTLVPFDTSGLALITEGLLQADFTAEEIGKIMGGNTIRVLLKSLPKNKPAVSGALN